MKIKYIIIAFLIILPIWILYPEQKVKAQPEREQIKTEQTDGRQIPINGQPNELEGFYRRVDILTPKSCENNICDYKFSKIFNPSTTTPCAIELPKSTTTPLIITISANATSTPIIWTIATSTSPNATTTVLYETRINSNHNSIVFSGADYASSTQRGLLFGGANNNVSNYLVIGAKGGTAARGANTFNNGSCRAELREL